MNETEEIDLTSGLAAFESKHFSRAMQYLSPLAKAGNAEAQYRVAIMFQNGLGLVANQTQAFTWLKQAAEQNHGLAQHGLGCCYLSGEGTVSNDEAAVYWLQRATEHELAGAQLALAKLYEQGRGVPIDLAKANRLYREAGF